MKLKASEPKPMTHDPAKPREEWVVCWPVEPGPAWVQEHDPNFSKDKNISRALKVVDRYSYDALAKELERINEERNTYRSVMHEVIEERDALLAQAEALAGALEANTFALQCMIIKWNGPVPGLTEQQVWDWAISARDDSKIALTTYRKFRGDE
jgi:hypothetical protein